MRARRAPTPMRSGSSRRFQICLCLLLRGRGSAPAAQQEPADRDADEEPAFRYRLSDAADTVCLDGWTPEGRHAKSLGLYELKRDWEFVNSRPVYAKRGEPHRLIWASHDGHWIAGHSDELGTATSGFLRVKDARAYFVEQIAEAAAWHARADADGGGDGWLAAPGVRLLHGAAAVAAWEQRQRLAEEALERAAKRLYLVGNAPQDTRREYLGGFSLQHDAERSNGRHVYSREGVDRVALWYDGDGAWRVGSQPNVGSSNSILALRSAAVLPEDARGVWRVHHPLGSGWLDAPALRLLHGADGLAALRADEAARHARAQVAPLTVILLAKGDAPARTQEYLGDYKRITGTNINGHPFYSKVTDSRLALWHTFDGSWFAGLADVMSGHFGHPKGVLRISTDDAALVPPEFGSATWEVWDEEAESWVAAPQLKLVKGAVKKDEI